MSRQKTQNIPASLSRARSRFNQWRKHRRPSDRIPEKLWSMAVDLAREHGFTRTAKALNLDYNTLKKKLGATPAPVSEQNGPTPNFIEFLNTELSTPRIECTIDLENSFGSKMRIHLKGSELPDLTSITRVFRGDEA